MNITIIPQLQDNFCFHVEHNKTSFIVDCSEVSKLSHYMKQQGKDFSHVFTTHKHHDHSGGNLDLAKTGKQVVGGSFDNIPGCTIPVQNE
jgi:hydroxyacylglutathione hydrolase